MPRKILLADDSVTAQNMGRKILSDAGYEVVTVSNGSAALKKVNELLPDIVVLDVYMPGYSGLEVCKLLKENTQTAEIPILLTVGKLEPFKSEEALKAKANAFIVKPFEATELLAVIRKIEEANSKAERKVSKTPKVNALAKVFAASPDSPEAQETGIEEKGWKNRLGMPSKKKAEPEAEEEAQAMGTAFRDLTPAPAEESGLRRESSFTSEAVAANAPAEAPLDISPEEIAAIRAAVEVLSGEGDRAPILHVAAVEGMPRQLAPEPEEALENLTVEIAAEVPRVSEAPQAEVAAAPDREVSGAVVTPTVSLTQTRWIAESVELTTADAAVSLEREMQEASGTAGPTETFNTYSLASFAESAVAEPVDDEPIVSEVAAAQVAAAATQAVAEVPASALAASASGDSNAISSLATTAPVIEVRAQVSAPAGFQDLRSAAAASPGLVPDIAADGVPGVAPRDTSAPEDEIDSRTKTQMDAAWSNWREIRNTLVTPNLTEQLAEVAAAAAKEDMAQEPAGSEATGHDSASIASIVDSVLAEMRPKLVEEIARKLAAKRE